MLARLLRARANIEDNTALEDIRLGAFKYSELDDLSDELAGGLANRVGRGDRVCALAPSSARFIALFFALRRLGATLVPINPNLERRVIQQIIERSKPKLVVDEYFGLGLSLEEIHGHSGYNQQGGGHEPAMILFTGGTTGAPKGALIPERQIVWNATNTILSWGLTRGDRAYNTMPLYHTGGWNVLTLPLLFVGGTVILDAGKFDPERTVRVLSERGCTVYMGVPTMLDAVTKAQGFGRVDLGRVLFISGGGVLPRPVFERFDARGLRIFQGYGLTEAGPNNFYIPPERFRSKPWSVGKPMVFVEAKLAESGELLIRGPHVFDGYLGGEENPFDGEGYLHTGDIFTVDGDGDYVFLDRVKDVIKSGGENVYSSEVEAAILENPMVSEVAVVGVPDEHWGEKVVAYLVCDERLNLADLRDDLKTRLAGFKVPKEFIRVGSLPKSAYGKVLKSELRKMYMEGARIGEDR
ncbi:MAG: AMP-binding protein [Thermoprotei archaeon]